MPARVAPEADGRISFRESLPLVFMHAGCLGLFWVGASPAALWVFAAAYVVRVFALTGGYHRYFSHHAFKTSRWFQFVLAFLGATAAQLGPLWWASHHRKHHLCADTQADIHSPSRRGFLWAHIGWLLCRGSAKTDMDRVPDFAKFPELVWLNRHSYLPPFLLAAFMYVLGAVLGPAHRTSGPQMLVWGFFVSTVVVYHVTFCINSMMHMFGTRRFDTPDTSKNNLLLALLSMGEGWHNNHHRYAISARQGFAWWEIDLTYYVLKLLEVLRLIWDLREPPAEVLAEVGA